MNGKRVLVFILVCILAFAVPADSWAVGESYGGVTPRYSYTRRVEAGLHISSSGNAHCEGAVAVYDASSTISIKVSLYQRVGNSWDRVTSWYGSRTDYDELVVEKDYQLTEYGTYKVLVTGTVTAAGGGSEWISLESTHMTYP